MRIGIDGFAMGQKQGTGLTTYAFELASALSRNGHDVSALFGLSSLGRDSTLHWPRFLQNLVLRGELKSEDWLRWAPRAVLYLLPHMAGRAFKPAHISRDKGGFVQLQDQRFPELDEIFNIPALYRSAQAHMLLLENPLKINRIPDIDLFHITSPLPVYMGGVPNVVTIHDTIPFAFPESTKANLKHYSRIVSASLKHAEAVLTVSEHSKRDLLRLFDIPEERIHVTYQSVDIPQSFRTIEPDVLEDFLQANFGLTPGGYFLYYGSIEPKKNVLRILNAHSMTKSDLPLVIAGKYGWMYDKEKQRIEALSSHSKAMKRVMKLDYLPYLSLMYLLKGARALVFPSLYEGFGLPVLEAMSMGIPVITSRTTSLPEVVSDAAHMVHPQSTNEISEAMDLLAGDEKLHAELTEKGLMRAEWFSPERHIKRVEAVYQKVLDSQ